MHGVDDTHLAPQKSHAKNRCLRSKKLYFLAIGNANIGSADLIELITEVEAAADTADKTAVAEKAKAIDLIAAPDSVEAHVVAAEPGRDQLQAILPKLRQRLVQVQAREYSERWVSDYKRVKARRGG